MMGSISTSEWTFLAWHASGFYFRVFGWGLAFDSRSPRAYFSERYGYRKVWRWGAGGRFTLSLLRPFRRAS
jgi:hypothetical protein